VSVAKDHFDVQYVTVHGHRRAFVKAGTGPVLLLVHGLACDHTTWDRVIGELAKRYTVIAPDLLGHGLSDKPRADYTVGGYANGMRDLLTVLGIDKVTVVGHSFGGGVAMQFAYQFPERTERLVLVDAGGLGAEVTPIIKAIQMPGWETAIRVLTRPGLRHAVKAAMRAGARLDSAVTRDLDEVADIFETWKDARTRFAIRHLVRAVIDWRGQIISMTDRAYLTEAMPVCVMWGRDDQILPVKHAESAATVAPHAQVTVFDRSGHFPQKDHPEEFVKVLEEFLASTEPFEYDRDALRELLLRGADVRVRQAEGDEGPVDPVRAESRARL
jgi:pimeloyl-ACP methyl ester carboxylesterase